jgi:DNA-directed RNA polymerase specialized sigma24 family protein
VNDFLEHLDRQYRSVEVRYMQAACRTLSDMDASYLWAEFLRMVHKRRVSREEFHSEGHVFAWVKRSLHKLLTRYRRGQTSYLRSPVGFHSVFDVDAMKTLPYVPASGVQEDQSPVLRPQVLEAVQRGMSRWSEKQRAAVELVVYQGMGEKAAGKILGVNFSSVRCRVSGALRHVEKEVSGVAA